jgi:hypothetical protein
LGYKTERKHGEFLEMNWLIFVGLIIATSAVHHSIHHHLNMSVIWKLEKLAESYYEAQKDERFMKIAEDFKKVGSNFPCIFGEIPIGGSNAEGIDDGHKYTCGVHLISGEPIVYSFGSCKDQGFELALLDLRPDAKIFVFEIDPKMLPEDRHPNITYFPLGLGGWDGNSNPAPNVKVNTMKQIMTTLGHGYVDIVKMDIEGHEFLWLHNEGSLVGRIGQFLVEVHVHTTMAQQMYPGEDALTFVRKLEEYGLRVFHQEVNRHAPLWGSEFALIRSTWSVFEEEKTLFKKFTTVISEG